jgi:trimeric autotransporter adhesin
MSRSGRKLTTMIVVALSSWSCGSTAPDVTSEVGSIVVSPASSTIALNAQLPLQAEVQDGSGTILPDAAITWTVQDPKIVSVSADGIVTALSVGTSKVAANALGKSGIATITVASNASPPPPASQAGVARVDVSPATPSVQAGESLLLAATPRDASGNVIGGKSVVWASDNSSVATVNGGHVATSRSGVATISASVDGVKGTATITVRPGPASSVTVTAPSKKLKPGSTMQLSAVATDSRGNVISNQTFFWASSDANTATVSATGVVTGKRAGNVTITAQTSQDGGKSGSVKITVK